MPIHLKYFQWLVYSAVAVQAAETLLMQKSWGDLVGFVVVALIVVVLAWAATHEKSRYAAWLLAIFFIFDAAFTVGLFWGPGPSWLQSALAPEQPATSLGKAMDAITNLLEFVALYFYFFGDNRAAAQR